MKKLILLVLFSSISIYSQLVSNGCLTDVYMGNYGFYDYQSAGANQSVTGGINSNYHAVYLSADSVLASPQKRALYFFSNNSGSNWVNTPVSNLNASYPSVGVQTDGNAVICFYDSASSRIKFYRTTAPTALTFDTLPSPPGTGGEYPKFQIISTKYIVLFAVFHTSSQPHISKTIYNYTAGTWSAWQIVAPNASTSFQSAKNVARIALSWIGDSTLKRVKYIESLDSGITFGSITTIFNQEITGGDTVRAFKNIDMTYPYPGSPTLPPNIVFDAVARILPEGGQPGIKKFYHNPKVFMWSQSGGIVKVADTLNYFYGDVAGRNTMVSMGKDCLPIGSPSISFSTVMGGSIHVFYSAMRLSRPKGNFWYDSDLVGLYGNGVSFNTIPGMIPEINYDDKFCFLTKQMPQNFGGYNIALIHQKDLFPGSYRQGDTTSITRAYPEFNGYNLIFHILHQDLLRFDYFLFPSYPNPFNGTAKIEFGLQKPGFVKIVVYDIVGREVQVLVNRQLSPVNFVTFFHSDGVPSGIYFYSMYVNDALIDTKKMVLVK
jgi:hypothetical protein